MKTLKDCKKAFYGLEAELLMDDLRSAAREWIRQNDEISDGIPSGYNVTTYKAVNKWIRHFFNLEEEIE